MEKPKPHEIELKASWIMDKGVMQLDKVGKRIEWLIHHYFKKIGTFNSGWNTIFQDPGDGRYWELSYPQGYMQGGGPALLQCVSTEKVGDVLKEIAATK